MLNGIQDKFLEIGRSGCYFLCLLKIAEEEGATSQNVFAVYETCVQEGFMKRTCFINNGKDILEMLTSKMWTYRYAEGNYQPLQDEWVIKRYVQKAGNGVQTHFVLYNDKNEEIFDPCLSAPAKRFGQITDCRVYCCK